MFYFTAITVGLLAGSTWTRYFSEGGSDWGHIIITPTEVMVIGSNVVLAIVSLWLAWLTFKQERHAQDNDDRQQDRLVAALREAMGVEQHDAHEAIAEGAAARALAQEHGTTPAIDSGTDTKGTTNG